MQQSPSFNSLNLVSVSDNEELTTTSLKIAELFGKRHDHVLRDIDVILTQVSVSFGETNFGGFDESYTNNLGHSVTQRAFRLTEAGATFLVLGFTGEKATSFKEALVNEFILMRSFINNRHAEEYAALKREMNHLNYKHMAVSLEHDTKDFQLTLVRKLFDLKGRKTLEKLEKMSSYKLRAVLEVVEKLEEQKRNDKLHAAIRDLLD